MHPPGKNDDSYKGGVKEDTACPGEDHRQHPEQQERPADVPRLRRSPAAVTQGFLNLAGAGCPSPVGPR